MASSSAASGTSNRPPPLPPLPPPLPPPTASTKILAAFARIPAVVDDLATTERWVGASMTVDVLVVAAFALGGLLGAAVPPPSPSLSPPISLAGAFLFPFLFARLFLLCVDLISLMCGVGWASRIGRRSGSALILPKAMRFLDEIGAALTLLMLLFAATSVVSPSRLARGGLPSLPRPGILRTPSLILQTAFFPLWLSTAVQLGMLIAAVLGTCDCPMVASCCPGVGLTPVLPPSHDPFALRGRRPPSGWRLLVSSLGCRFLILLLNLATIPLVVKMDNYRLIPSWDGPLYLGWTVVILVGGAGFLLSLGFLAEHVLALTRGGGGEGHFLTADTEGPAAEDARLAEAIRSCKHRPVVGFFLVLSCMVAAVCGAVSLEAAGRVLRSAERRMLDSLSPVVSSPSLPPFPPRQSPKDGLLLTQGEELLVLLPLIVGTATLAFLTLYGAGPALSNFREEFAQVWGTQTPTSFSAAQMAAGNFGDGGAGNRAGARGRGGLRPFVGPALPPPRYLVCVGQPSSSLFRRPNTRETEAISRAFEVKDAAKAVEAQPPNISSAESTLSSSSLPPRPLSARARPLHPLHPQTPVATASASASASASARPPRHEGSQHQAPSGPAPAPILPAGARLQNIPRRSAPASRGHRPPMPLPPSSAVSCSPRSPSPTGPAGSVSPASSTSSTSSQQLCVICCSEEADAVFLECGHGGICGVCGERIWRGSSSDKRCPLCRAHVDHVVRLEAGGLRAGVRVQVGGRHGRGRSSDSGGAAAQEGDGTPWGSGLGSGGSGGELPLLAVRIRGGEEGGGAAAAVAAQRR